MKRQVRLLSLDTPDDLMREFSRIGVDAGGWVRMGPKGFMRFVKVSRLPSFCANILKQEMLSLGADAAVSRAALSGGSRLTDCLLFGNLSQLSLLTQKLKRQPFGLSQLSGVLRDILARASRQRVCLDIDGKITHLGRRTWLMGIVNVTPDSFSGDGLGRRPVGEVVRLVEDMAAGGADIIDIGGASSRPGARPVNAKEERDRVIPLLKALRGRVRVPVSVDTTKSEVAQAALDHGARIINDISALRGDRRMAKVLARSRAAVVLMHMKGAPRTMQRSPRYDDVMGEVTAFLAEAIDRALEAGIASRRVIVDPGIGFGKTFEHNVEILKRLPELRILGRPVLVGLSRKSFIGRVLGRPASERIWGTAAATALAAQSAEILRVHDVREMKQVVMMTDALTKRGHGHE